MSDRHCRYCQQVFQPPPIVRNKSFAASRLASVVAAANIITTRFVPIPSTPIPCHVAGRSGVTRIPAIRSSIGRATRKQSSGTANSNICVTGVIACGCL